MDKKKVISFLVLNNILTHGYAIDERQDRTQDSRSLSFYLSDIKLLAWQLGYENT